LDRTIDCLRVAAQSAGPSEQSRFHQQIHILESRRTDLIETSAMGGSSSHRPMPPMSNNINSPSDRSPYISPPASFPSSANTSGSSADWPPAPSAYLQEANPRPMKRPTLSPPPGVPPSSELLNLAAIVHHHLATATPNPNDSTLSRFLNGTLNTGMGAQMPHPQMAAMPRRPLPLNMAPVAPPMMAYPNSMTMAFMRDNATHAPLQPPPMHHYYPAHQQAPPKAVMMEPNGGPCWYAPTVGYAV